MTDLGQGASAGWLPGGRRFLQHGPINLVVDVWGAGAAPRLALQQLEREFPQWLGSWLGTRALERIDERRFTWFYQGVLTLLALRLVAQAVMR